MTSFSKIAYWRPLVPNAESMDKTTNPYFKISHVPPVAEKEAKFVMVKYIFSMWFSIPIFTATYKYIKYFASEIFKHTRSGKPDVDEAPHIEVCVNTNIQ